MDNEAEQLFIRIYTDEHITALLAPALRRRGYVAQSCIEVNALGWDDEEHLVYATERGMAFMTSDASETIAAARSRISPAALFVKVTARIERGSTPSSRMR